MNSHPPSGSDGFPTPPPADRSSCCSDHATPESEIFDQAERERLKLLRPPEPSPTEWQELERRLCRHLLDFATSRQHDGFSSRIRRNLSPWIALSVFFLTSIGAVSLFHSRWQPPEVAVPKITEKDTERDSKPPIDDEGLPAVEYFPLAASGDFRVVSYQPVPGCDEPILPPPNCPNCPMVYASASP